MKDFVICDECIWLMVEVIAEGRPEWVEQKIAAIERFRAKANTVKE